MRIGKCFSMNRSGVCIKCGAIFPSTDKRCPSCGYNEEDLIEKIHKRTGIQHEKIRKAFTIVKSDKSRAMQLIENIERGLVEPICPKCSGFMFKNKDEISFTIIYCVGCGHIIGAIRP